MAKSLRAATLALLLLLPALLAAQRADRGRFAYDPAAGVVALEGEWDFFWGDFIDPAGEVDRAPDAVGRIPGCWADYGVPGAGGEGYGSYRLRVTGLEPGERYGIKLGGFMTAARTYADGKELRSQGVPGTSIAEEVPRWESYVADAAAGPTGEMVLVVHASNFHDRLGGDTKPILFGPYKPVEAAAAGLLAYDVFFFAALLAMGLYYLVLFLFRPAEKAALWFAAVCLLLSLRSVCYGEFLLHDLLPGMDWEALAKLGSLSFALPVAAFFLFLRQLYPARLPKAALAACASAPALFALAVLLLPARAYSQLLLPFQALVGLGGIYTVVVLIRARIKRDPGASWILGSFALLFACMVHDMFLVQVFLQDVQLAPFGLLAMVYALSLVVTRKYAVAYAAAERLSGSFRRMNLSLRRLIPKEFLRYLGEREGPAAGLELRRATALYVRARPERREGPPPAPEERERAAARLLKRVAPLVKEGGGFVDRYVGDGFLAIFPDRPDEALRAAIKMRRAAAAFDAEQAMGGKARAALGVGLHTGYLALPEGHAGAPSGDAMPAEVAIAAQAEAIAGEFGAGIVLDEGSLTLLEAPAAHRLRFLGRFPRLPRRRGEPAPAAEEEVACFEAYEGDDDANVAGKDAIAGAFEKALSAFLEGRKQEAAQGFRACLALHPDDGPSKRYLELLGG